MLFWMGGACAPSATPPIPPRPSGQGGAAGPLWFGRDEPKPKQKQEDIFEQDEIDIMDILPMVAPLLCRSVD